MPAATYNFTIEQGATYVQSFVYRDSNGVGINLTGYLIRLELRSGFGGSVIWDTDNDLLGGITIDDQVATPGQFTVRAEASTTGAMNFDSGPYDLELVAPGSPPRFVTRLLQGRITLSPEVSIDT